MKKYLKQVQKETIITKEEIIADVIFLSVSAFVSLMVVFLFDIHHSFYTWPMTVEFIFNTSYPYFIFVPIGAIIGLFVIKLILVGFKEEYT